MATVQEGFFKTTDYGTVGYLFARGIHHQRVERDGPHVVFYFAASPKVTAAVGDYLSNRPVPCRDYHHGLRKAKSIIWEITNDGNSAARKSA